MRGRFLTLLLLWSGAAVAQTPHTAQLASVFLDSIGINGSGSAATDGPLLAFTGIRHVRVQAGATGDTASQLLAYSSTGARLLVEQSYCFCAIATADEATWISQYPAAAIAVTEAIGGPNELVLGGDPDSFNGSGMTSAAGATAYQAALYGAAKANSTTAALPVLTYTLGIGVNPAGFQVGGNADVDDRHCYAANTASGASTLAYCQTYAALASGAPQWMTEAGYSTASNPSYGTDEATQADYDLKFHVLAFLGGIQRTYQYTIINYGDDGFSGGAATSDFNAYFGLFRSSGIPKTVANAYRDLIYLLGRNPAGGTLATPGSLAYTLSGMPSGSSSLLLEQPGGVFDLVLVWDGRSWSGSGPVSVGTASVTMTLGAAAGTMDVFDPVVSPAAQQSAAGASTISTTLSDHPLLLEIRPPSGGRA